MEFSNTFRSTKEIEFFCMKPRGQIDRPLMAGNENYIKTVTRSFFTILQMSP